MHRRNGRRRHRSSSSPCPHRSTTATHVGRRHCGAHSTKPPTFCRPTRRSGSVILRPHRRWRPRPAAPPPRPPERRRRDDTGRLVCRSGPHACSHRRRGGQRSPCASCMYAPDTAVGERPRGAAVGTGTVADHPQHVQHPHRKHQRPQHQQQQHSIIGRRRSRTSTTAATASHSTEPRRRRRGRPRRLASMATNFIRLRHSPATRANTVATAAVAVHRAPRANYKKRKRLKPNSAANSNDTK